MTVELTGDDERLIARQMRLGQYESADAVIGSALRILDELSTDPPAIVDPDSERELTTEELRAEIRSGLDAIEAGDVGPLDLDEIRSRLRNRRTSA